MLRLTVRSRRLKKLTGRSRKHRLLSAGLYIVGAYPMTFVTSDFWAGMFQSNGLGRLAKVLFLYFLLFGGVHERPSKLVPPFFPRLLVLLDSVESRLNDVLPS